MPESIHFHTTRPMARLDDPGPGKHQWIVCAAWRVSPPFAEGTPIILDHENLANQTEPFCAKCERSWRPGIDDTACDGEMPAHLGGSHDGRS